MFYRNEDNIMCNCKYLNYNSFTMCKSSVIFLVCVIWKFISVNAQPSSHSGIFTSPTNECFFQCINATGYDECLQNCEASWPFVTIIDESGHCGIPSVSNEDPAVACSPRNFKYQLINRTSDDGQVSSYALYSWQPCNAAIRFVTSFLLKIVGFSSHCYTLQLKPNMTLNYTHHNVWFRYMYQKKLKPKHHYTASLSALPRRPDERPAQLEFTSASCKELNSPFSCFCVKEGKVELPPIDVKVSGYSVNVVAVPANTCFEIANYQFIITPIPPNQHIRIDQQSLHQPPAGQNLSHTFRNIYDTFKPLQVSILTIGHQGFGGKSNRVRVNIQAWQPVQPNYTLLTWSSVEVFFAEPDDYNIAMYMIRLSKLEHEDGVITNNITADTVNASADANGKVAHTFYGLEDGAVYSVQVREFRPEIRTAEHQAYFKPSVWGPDQEFIIDEPSEPPASEKVSINVTVLIIVIFVLLTCIIVAGVVFLACWKKGRCRPFRKALPAPWVEWLDTQTIHLTSKTVLLVWQADFRSPDLQEKHAEVVSRLAAFLRTVCSLEVILDLYDETELSRGIADWVQKSFSRADVVVFVCPHFNYTSEREQLASLTGNFRRMYSYAEGDLGDRSRYVTALLPYSDLSSSSATEFLQKMTSVFNLMEQIEDLYFHIQGFSKFDCLGRNGAVNISDRDYQKTPVGATLHRSMKQFKDMLKDYSRSSSIAGSSSLDDSQDETPCSSSDSRSYEEQKTLLADKDDKSSDFVEEDPVLMNSLSMVEGPTPTDHLIERVRPPLEPIAPFVDNPEEELLRINQRPNEELITEVEFCPYHSRSDVVLSSKSLPSAVVDHQNNAYGQDSRSFHIVELSEEENTCGDASTAPDSGFNSSRV